MSTNWIILTITIVYIGLMVLIGIRTKKYSDSSEKYTTGGRAFAPVLIGFMMMSEFIGTSASVGTIQSAYSHGVSVAWNLATLGIGFTLFALILAKKFIQLGESTISGALARTYGQPTKLATSLIMIFAFEIIMIATYSGGGSVLSGLLGIDRTSAIVIISIVSVIYVFLGGMSALIYTNLSHALLMYLGIILACAFAVGAAGGLPAIGERLSPSMLDWTSVGWPQIMAWLIANTGAVFSTQYIIQAISSIKEGGKARRASLYSGLLVIPFAVFATLVGVACAVLFPDVESFEALPSLLAMMNQFCAGLIVAGLAAALFGTISALSMASATLILKDIYQPLFNRERDDRKSLLFVKTATVIVGLLPIPLALYADHVLVVAFLGRALRTSIGVLVIMMFYTPNFGNGRGAFWSIMCSLVMTIVWFLMGNPLGIDNTYVALLTPILVMSISHVLSGRTRQGVSPMRLNMESEHE